MDSAQDFQVHRFENPATGSSPAMAYRNRDRIRHEELSGLARSGHMRNRNVARNCCSPVRTAEINQVHPLEPIRSSRESSRDDLPLHEKLPSIRSAAQHSASAGL